MYERLKHILENSERIVFFGGAGVSTESGIPDFRSESGLYSAEQKYGRPPEELISLRFFFSHPEVFFAYYKENLICLDAKPNPAHLALARLESRGVLHAVVTQNIDGLHQAAGSRRVFELHGSVARNYCVDCKASYSLAYTLDPGNCRDASGRPASIPRCGACGGIVRPDVVLYDESLDEAVLSGAVAAIRAADTLIVGGTSLVVYPAAGLLRYFRGGNLVLINRSQTDYDHMAQLVLRDPIGQVLGAAVE